MAVYVIPKYGAIFKQAAITDASTDTTASQSCASAVNDILARLRTAGIIG